MTPPPLNQSDGDICDSFLEFVLFYGIFSVKKTVMSISKISSVKRHCSHILCKFIHNSPNNFFGFCSYLGT